MEPCPIDNSISASTNTFHNGLQQFHISIFATGFASRLRSLSTDFPHHWPCDGHVAPAKTLVCHGATVNSNPGAVVFHLRRADLRSDACQQCRSAAADGYYHPGCAERHVDECHPPTPGLGRIIFQQHLHYAKLARQGPPSGRRIPPQGHSDPGPASCLPGERVGHLLR